jgi:hypothetical protein
MYQPPAGGEAPNESGGDKQHQRPALTDAV